MADTATEERTEEAQAPAGDLQGPQAETPQPQAARPRATGSEEKGVEAGTERGAAAGAQAERARPVTEGKPGGMASGAGGQDHAARTIEFLSNLELEAAAELGRANLSIGEVLKLRPGSVVQLEKTLGDPAELMIKGRLIARGEVVVVDDRFGLRITEVLSRESE